jgi:broad specificity phosphatase PhoE
MRPSSPLARPLSRRRFAALVPLAAAALSFAAPHRPAGAQAADEPTVVLVTRHAERAQEPGPDPALDATGTRRAQALAAALQDAGVSTAIVTQYKRTRLTAAPLAEQQKIPVVERPVTSGQVDAYAAALAQEIRASHQGRTVLVVGHSNTVPAIVAALSGKQIGAIPDERYGDVYVVTMPRGSGAPRLLRMRVDPTP